ncbi:heat shock 70 kDa protein 12A-like [Mytilus edulis]|uniref:heat shock 70 kDa protein 12A-like n=1 Tax=Mytilus edulis TaxID=6550 RepID=UPI0039F07988
MGGALRKWRRNRKSKQRKNNPMSLSTPNLLESQPKVEYRHKHSRKDRFSSGFNQHNFTASEPDLRISNQQKENSDVEVSSKSQADVVISPSYHENKKAGHNRLFIAAIDIGTTYSGYAYSARHDVEKDPSNILCPQWRGDNVLHYKTATAVLFDEHGQFNEFGFNAETNYHEIMDEKDDILACYFFNDFKMLLYEKKNDLNKDIDITDITGKTMKAIKVFSASIRYLKEHLLGALHKSFVRDSYISNTDIHWVLTVPAIWEMKAKQFMRDAAEMAGISADQLSLALEPEAASLYCQKVPMSIKESELTTLNLLGSGISYVVLDMGGGTFDVTGHQIEDDNFLKEIFPPNGGNWGGNNVNYEFEKYLEELFTTEVVHKVKRDNPVDYFEAVRQFEEKKKSFNPKSDADVILVVSPAFKEGYENTQNSDLPSEIQIEHGKMRISASRFKAFFDQSIQSIISHLSEIFRSSKLQNVDIILAVGGFSESEIIIDSIREHFPYMQIIVPKDPGLAVLKGAVLFGLEPLSVKSRISRYTYGIKIEKEISTEEDERYRTLRKNRQSIKFATDVFEKLVEIGEEIKVGEWQPATEYDPISKDDQEVKIEFYATEDKDPVHVTDPGCMKLGTLNVDLKERTSSNGALKLEINAGGTEIKAVITDENTGKKFKAKFCLP